MGELVVRIGERMFRVTEEVRFCYGHRLMDYVGPCARIHDHNARAEIETDTAVATYDER